MPKEKAQGEDDKGDEPQFVTVEQLNAAIAGKLSDFKKSLPKLLEAPLQQFGAQLLESLKPQGEEESPKGKSKPDPELDKLRKENQATKDALSKMQADQERAAQAVKREKSRGLLEASLTAAKVHPKLLGAATRLLEDSVGESEDGRIVFKRQNAYGITEEVSVEQAIKDWSKTDDGKAFVIAPNARGSGGGPTPRPVFPPNVQNQRGVQDPKAVEMDKIQSAKRELANAFLDLPAEE